MTTRLFSLFALLLVVPWAPAADPAAVDAQLLTTARSLFADVKTETLPNGLRVYLLPIPGAPVVSTMLAYKVGSGDEDKDQTGLSHYLEHLMFKGTEKLMPGDIDRLTQRNGGKNNAYTNEDMTVYHFDFAADRWEVALEIEADRMRNVRIDAKHEFQQEKGAVVSELKGNEDEPWDVEYKAILPLLFPKDSPYSHPVIGEEKHVRAATAEIIKRHYDKWYHPNNASLVIAGGFDPKSAMVKINALFGPIPKGELPPRRESTPQPVRTKQVRKEFGTKFDVTRMLAGFNTIPFGHPDDYVFDWLVEILGSGKTGRLHQRLVETDRLANAVKATNNAFRRDGYFELGVELIKDKSRAKAEAAVFDELAKLAAEPISPAEFARVRRSMIAAFIFSRESVHDLADYVAKTVAYLNFEYLTTYLDRILAVTPADIQRVAKTYLAKNRSVVVWGLDEEDPAPAGKGKGVNRQAVPATAGSGGYALTDAKRIVLPNGLTLLLLENHRLPIVMADAYVADVRLREPAAKAGVAALVGYLLEEGTKTRTGDEIATQIEDVGGLLDFNPSGGSVKVLTPDTKLGLTLLLDSLIHPSFPAEALDKKRDQLLSDIAIVDTAPQSRAKQAFAQIVYGRHPYGRAAQGSQRIVKKLTPADCQAFHAAAFAPNWTTMIVTGDFDAKAMEKLITDLTADWKPIKADKPTPAAPPVAKKPVEKIITDPTASQTHIYIGHLGVKRDDPDYYTLLVLDNVLGTGYGFTDRLSASLRDRQGLAYTVTAQITATAADQPGTFLGYIGTFPDKYHVAKEGFLAEIAKIRTAPATEQEVDDAKKFLLGSLPFKLATGHDVAGQLLIAERFGLGFDYLTEYKVKVAAVTPAMVQAAAAKHLDPARLVIVACGPIDAAGKPLPEPK